MGSELTWRMAIDKVLAASGTALHYSEIAERIIAEGYRDNLGATPAATVNGQITTSLKRDGDASPYLRVAPGVYGLRTASSGSPARPRPTSGGGSTDENEEQYDLVSSFGMFWQRSAVEWVSTPRLLGMQQIGATPVDFCGQLGIYLLYDGREVVYVGRTTERPLGRRLYEHTLDRMSVRWDRFSWFGLLPVSETGELGKLPASFAATKLIPALEALLIEALEPRQNRKRGDDLAAVEYIQKSDPEIEKKRMKATLDVAISRL